MYIFPDPGIRLRPPATPELQRNRAPQNLPIAFCAAAHAPMPRRLPRTHSTFPPAAPYNADACALIRHAYGQMYRDFTLVDTQTLPALQLENHALPRARFADRRLFPLRRAPIDTPSVSE